MAYEVQTGLMQATEIARQSDLRQSTNGVHYTAFGENNLETADLDRIVQAVPATIAASLGRKAYYFVPLALTERPAVPLSDDDPASASDAPIRAGEMIGDHDTLIATTYSVEFSDRAICHRNVRLPGKDGSGKEGSGNDGSIEGVFISTRLLADRFALAFEFFINVGHAFVDVAGIPDSFADLVWKQALADVRGETSQDAWETRALSLSSESASRGADPGLQSARNRGPDYNKPSVKSNAAVDEKAKFEFLEAAFSDAIAIYQLSLAIDFDYAELRERDYPLLAPQALADRLRLVAKLFPPNPGYDFAIRYRRRN